MFRNVFIGVDGTSHGRDAIALATVLAEPGARLTLVHVQPGATPAAAAGVDRSLVDPTYYAAGRGESDQLLEAEREATVVSAELVTVPGPSVGPALHAIAEQEQADLLVVGACKHRLAGRILIGDDTRASVNGATCPVGIAPDGYAAAAAPPATIGVGFDFSEESRAALEAARDLAVRHRSKIIALDVVAAEPVGEYLSPFGEDPLDVLERHRARAEGGLAAIEEVDARAVTGVPCKTLAEFADHVDLLVVGSRTQSRLRRVMFGSTSLRLARHVHHPMLVMPHATIGHARPDLGGGATGTPTVGATP
ncbi:MAG TPA: universal stress protein [Solirubrobacteraceae bacterium]